MNLKSGQVTVPQDGLYEITFTGALKTFNAKRVWVTIVKKPHNEEGTFFSFTKIHYFSLELM